MAFADSILLRPSAIALLLNETALDDFQIFMGSLLLWESKPPPLYIYCTTITKSSILQWTDKYPSPIYMKDALNVYKHLNRQEMESMPSKRGLSNLFHDFTQEKCSLMKWALSSLSETEKEGGVLFCDADIVWMGPLPEIPRGYLLGLSPHMIRAHDEEKYGNYNAGFLWMKDTTLPEKWLKACETSRFFEQAALEDIAKDVESAALYLFGPEYNFGWWRLYQSSNSLEEQKKRWTFKRDSQEKHTGLLVDGKPLSCIHTHWKTTDFVTASFNKFILEKLKVLKTQSKVRKLLQTVLGVRL